MVRVRVQLLKNLSQQAAAAAERADLPAVRDVYLRHAERWAKLAAEHDGDGRRPVGETGPFA